MNYKDYYKHLLNEAYGDAEKIKWKQQFPTLSANIINSYIEKFDTIRKTRPSAAQHDIDGFNIAKGNDRYDISKYNDWKDFETFIDYVNGQVNLEKSKGKKFTDIKVDGKPLVEKNGLEIYYAMDKRACIKYKGDKPYNWCVSRSDASNMYNTYRYKHHEPSFYFVKDVEATQKEFENGFDGKFKNPWHFFVIQKTKDGDYIVTSANNDGDTTVSWNEILEVQPKLNGMEEYFVNIPLSDIERQNYNRFIEGLSDRQFARLNYEEKESYLDIAIPHNELTDFQFKALPDDLKNKYIGFGLAITEGQYEIIKKNKNLLKRLNEICVRRFESYKKDEIRFSYLNTVDFQVIAALPNASQILKFINDEHFLIFIKTINLTLNELIKLFGIDTITSLFKENPQKSFELYDDIEITKQIAQILNEKMQSVFIRNRNINSLYLYGSMSRKFYENVNNLISVIDLILTYRNKLRLDECSYILDDIDCSKDFQYIISDKIFELYQQDKIEHVNGGSPIGLNKEYVADLLARILMSNKNPEKIFDYVDFSIWEHLSSNTLKHLFGHQNKIIQNKFAPIFKKSLKMSSLISGFIYTLNNRKKIINFIQKMGGVENIKNRIPEYGCATILYNTPTINLPLIASLIPKQHIEKFSDYDINTLITNSIVDTKEQNQIIRLSLLFKIIGAEKIKQSIKGSTFYFALEDIFRNYPQSITNTVDKFFELLIKTKGNELKSGGILNDVETILTFGDDLDKMVNLIGRKKINDLSADSIYNLLSKKFNYINFNKNIKLLELLGTNNVSKILEIVDKETTHSIGNNSYHLFANASRMPPLFEYLIKQLVASGANMNRLTINNIIGCTMNRDLEKIGNILGPEKISLLDDYSITYNLSRRSDKDSIINLFIKSFDKEKLMNLVIKSLGEKWESKVSKQTYQILTGAVTESLFYKNYYL